MSIEQDLNRIANALEKIVDGLSPTVTGVYAPPVVAAAQEAEPETQTTGEAVCGPRSRQEVKQKLDDLGIAYNDRLRTENLEKMLQDHENSGAAKPAAAPAPTAPAEDPFAAAPQALHPQQTYKVTPADPKKPGSRRTVVPNPLPAPDVQADFFGGDPTAKPAAAPAEKVYTVTEAIEIAKRLAAKFGPDKSVTIIQSYGCAKISEIEAKGKLQDFVKKVLAKEKEYERK